MMDWLPRLGFAIAWGQHSLASFAGSLKPFGSSID
jgi:hypothetical protein